MLLGNRILLIIENITNFKVDKMPEFNLLESVPKIFRNIKERKLNKDNAMLIAKEFGKEYFDGDRVYGYGGYKYDGRWIPIAKKIINKYYLTSGSKVLDIGCAKGFLLQDLKNECEGLEVYGLDISEYAFSKVSDSIKDNVIIGDAKSLPYKDNFFDCTLCINVIHNLDILGCKQAISEIIRVTKNNNSFIQVDAFTNKVEEKLFLDWVLTALTYGKPDFWLKIFDELGYKGDYYWTIIKYEKELLKDR